MSGWQGANVKDRVEKQVENQETIEAALHRLKSAYTISIETIGGWHRADRDNAEPSKIIELGWAARRSLENKILGDPWILLPHAGSYARQANRLRDQTTEAPPLRSDSHKAAVKQLAYLGLVNYADLLLGGLAETSKSATTVLDRGVIRGLQTLSPGESCWISQISQFNREAKDTDGDEPVHRNDKQEVEPECSTLRLALVTYLDAVSLDASDPSLWVKLACAARRLDPEKYRPLIRYSLERATTALSRQDPPMAVAVRALQELNEEILPVVCFDELGYPIADEFTLEIPRYSWSVVGRALLRIGKQGSPKLTLTISPLLILPVPALKVVCSFLRNTEALEGTCRALSASVLAARTLQNFQRRKSDVATSVSVPPNVLPPKIPSPEPQIDHETSDSADQNTAKRTSKRVLSQIITSGKRSLRDSRRNSVDFCLFAAIFGCTRNDPRFLKFLEDGRIERTSDREATQAKADISWSNGSNLPGGDNRIGPSSLTSFITNCPQDTSPLIALFHFVAHCSRHVADVIASDSGGSLVFGTCLLDCIEWMGKHTLLSEDFQCLWSTNSSRVPRGVRLSPEDIFAIDLLHCELRFKRCQHDELAFLLYDSDANFVASSISALMSKSVEKRELKIRLYWLASLIHFWLAAYCSDVSEARATEARGLSLIDDAIALLSAVDGALQTPHLVSPRRKGRHWRELSVETLQSFKREKQASSIVFVAQEKFLRVTNDIVGQNNADLSEESLNLLEEIGDSLLKRYNDALAAENAKYDELVDDFVNVYGKVLMSVLESNDHSKNEQNLPKILTIAEWIDSLFPFHRITKQQQLTGVVKSPSILTILVSCLLTAKDPSLSALALLFVRIVASVSYAIVNISNSQSDEEEDYDDDSLAGSNARATPVKLRCLIALLPVLLRKLSTLAASLEIFEQESLLQSTDFVEMLQASFSGLASDQFRFLGAGTVAIETLSSLRSLLSLGKPFFDVCKRNEDCALRQYLIGLMQVLSAQHLTLREYSEARPKSRSERNKITRRICDLAAQACCDLALIISSHPCVLRDGSLFVSELLNSITTWNPSLIPKLCDSLLWFWTASTSDEADDIGRHESGRLSWCLDRFGKERLRIPVACAIISLCGSVIGSLVFVNSEGTEDVSRLVDFYDSDASANDWLEVNCGKRKVEELLRILSQAAHCIHLVFTAIDTSDSMRYPHSTNYQTPFGPLLPLVTLRSLNRLALHLVLGFSEQNGQQALLEVYSYPVGTRHLGQIVDDCLNRVYRCLHGFTLSTSTEKESMHASDMHRFGTYPPENLDAAVMIYKAIMRLSGQGRKLPPKAAMDTVAKALPKNHESSEVLNELKRFLFASDTRGNVFNELLDVVSHLETCRPPIDLGAPRAGDSITDKSTFLRRGLAKLVAQGPIPFCQESEDSDSTATSAQTEIELSAKFQAIVEVLSCGNLCDGEEWFKAAQCLLEKADIVADRIGLSKGFTRCSLFLVPERRQLVNNGKLDDLLREQIKHSEEMKTNWIAHLGDDLSGCVENTWSDINSLQKYASAIANHVRAETELSLIEKKAVQSLCSPRNSADLAAWHSAWGGIFVSSLRIIACRCLMLSLHTLNVTENTVSVQIHSEILESIGSFYYKHLMGSQMYGYPMQPMTEADKRTIAIASLTCFEKSIDVLISKEGTFDSKMVWDLHFMSGKCNEKIASTFLRESFSSGRTERKYEEYMRRAFNCYAKACELAIQAEKDGDLSPDQGASSHGSAEAVYRLHASRLKCLIFAATNKDEQRYQAEVEALRLVEANWFKTPKINNHETLSHRNRVWKVLGDVVGVLAKLRSENSFFHRSVYRHAQALLWAPVLYEPCVGMKNGSLSNIPTSWLREVPGLDHATTSNESALEVIRQLFTRKRPQLVAAWFSQGGETVIQQINASIRKYDSLRGKYIAAYIDVLALCKERVEVDTLLRSTNSTPRDLPSRFHAYAEIWSGTCNTSPIDCLLPNKTLSSKFFVVSIKRRANGALANILVNDLSKPEKRNESSMFYRDELKIAYSCFLRIRCDAETLAKWISGPYNRDPSIIAVVNAVTAVYELFSKEKVASRQDVLDWSGEVQLANQLLFCLKKCSLLFPSLNANYSFSKPKTSSKQGKGKRHQDELEKKSFDVAIPAGLDEGESFLTTVMLGNVQKTIRLTVPANAASTIRFSLDIESCNEVHEPPKKTAKTG